MAKSQERVRANAQGKVTATRRDTGTVEREEELHAEEEFDMDVGDKGANIGNRRGFKKWASDKDHGLTVESTVTVTLTCNQDKKSILLAGAMAGSLAEQVAMQGIQEMNQYFDIEG